MSRFIIGIGSSSPQAHSYIQRAILQMGISSFIEVNSVSDFYPNPAAFGMTQYGFVNAAVAVTSKLPTDGLWSILRAIEHKLGRIRLIKNGSRTIDLDLLCCAHENMSTEKVTLPHPGLTSRPFALNPAKQVAQRAGWIFKAFYWQIDYDRVINN